jgi:hypothetical protein
MKTPLQILRIAYALIEDRDRWCQQAPARDATGASTTAVAPAACQWSGQGALINAAGADKGGEAWRIAQRMLDLGAERYGMTVQEVNDKLGHNMVLQAFLSAIGREKQRAPVEAAKRYREAMWN